MSMTPLLNVLNGSPLWLTSGTQAMTAGLSTVQGSKGLQNITSTSVYTAEKPTDRLCQEQAAEAHSNRCVVHYFLDETPQLKGSQGCGSTQPRNCMRGVAPLQEHTARGASAGCQQQAKGALAGHQGVA